MGIADQLELGSWNVVCYECGNKRKSSYMLRHWQGYYLCPEHWEYRQPQDFVRAKADQQAPAWAQPMPQDTFASTCDINGNTAVSDCAVSDCVTSDYVAPGFNPIVQPY